MPDLPDYDLHATPQEPAVPPPRRDPTLARAVLAVVVITVVGAGTYLLLRNRAPAPQPAAAGAQAPTPEAKPQPRAALGAEPMPVTLPSLNESDALVRRLVATLSSHPRVAAWLTTKDLVRNVAVVVNAVADGRTPAAQLRVLRPTERFRTIERGSGLYIDPRSYERYSPLAAAADSIDPAGAARLYATLKPLLQEADNELGNPGHSFDDVVEQAIVRLLRTPVLTDPVAVVPQGIVYAYEDPAVQRLTAAQKQLLRAGPANVRTIQAALRRIGVALGIPAERLR